MSSRRSTLWLALLTISLGSTGCTTLYIAQIQYKLSPLARDVESERAQCDFGPAHSDVIGIGVSGGGSRAAVYAAAGLEALWEHGMIEHVTHLSSVSGGSIAASYFAANRPDCTGADAERDACWRAFFSEFKQAMRHNFFRSMILRQIGWMRIGSNTRRATSLAGALDSKFLDGKTFEELRSTATDGTSEPGKPVLLVNASSYDDARRFVFSNLCIRASANEAAAKTTSGSSPLARSELRARTFSRPSCPRSLPGAFPVSLAVASSASFPGIGPVTLQVPKDCHGGDPEWWHLGDGGIFDNSGVDTLEEVVLWQRNDQRTPLRRALILSLDSGKRADPSKLRLIKNMWLYAQHPGLMFDIASRRGQAYHDLVWERLRDDFAEEGIALETFQIRYANAELDVWPASCRAQAALGLSIRDALEDIPTSLSISDCHADLLELAAHQMVHATLNGEVVDRMQSEGFSIRAVPEDHEGPVPEL